MSESEKLIDFDFTKVIVEVKDEIKRIKGSQSQAEVVLDHMRANRDQQRAVNNPKSEKMFAKAVSDLERLVSSQEALTAGGSEVVATFRAADKALKKYLRAALKTEKNAEKAYATVEKISKAAGK